MAHIKKSEGIALPQVKEVHVVVDTNLIKECLQKRSLKGLENVKWPKAVKAMYHNMEAKEIQLLHIESCCRKAREEVVTPFKDALWDIIVAHTNIKDL
jgi:hypothetical protein